MDVGVVGAGRVGTAVAVLLARAGHRIVGVSGAGPATAERATKWLPEVPVLPPGEVARRSELLLLVAPDDRLAEVVTDVAADVPQGAWVAHLAGSMGLEVLRPVLDAGGRRLAVHPLQTFPDVEGALERLSGCAVAITADDQEGFTLGESIARDLGARPFRLADEFRPLYHAAAVFASNYLVAVAAAAERLLSLAAVEDPLTALLPLQRATLANVERLGVGDALTGPAVRGDAGTIAANLQAIAAEAPDLAPAYVAMCRVALDLATRSGRLDAAGRTAVEEALAPWS